MSLDRDVLGRGLDHLLGKTNETEQPSENTILQVSIEKVHPNSNQPRKYFDEQGLKDLSSSIGKQGLLQPIVVSKTPEGNYQIIAGERRWRAVQKLGWARIPVILKPNPKEEQKLVLALVENLQRKDLNPIEEATSFKWLIEHQKWSQQKVAEEMGRDRSSIANTLRLLQLHPDVQLLLSKNKISFSIAKLLLQEKSQERQKILARKACQEQWTVKDLEKKINKVIAEKKKEEIPFWLQERCEALSKKWNAHVHVNLKTNGGSVSLNFSKEEELREFLDHE